jgi:DNA-binding SARP family transcriptional activator
MAPEMEFCLLGPLTVRKDGRVVPSLAAKQRVVLAALLLHAGRVVTLDTLAEAVWGAEPPASARATLQNYVKRLRKALGDTRHSRIATMPQGYQINVADSELDLSRFQALRGEAQRAMVGGRCEEAAARLRDALALWRGEPLTGMPSNALLLREKPRLVELHSEALEARIDADLKLGRHGAVIAELRQFSAAYPLRERAHGMLMLALYRDGRRADALAAYQHARQVLVSELGLEPGPGLRDLHQRILCADPALLLPGNPAAGDEKAIATLTPGPATASQRHGTGSASGAPAPSPVIPRQLPTAVRHFAGRQAELKALAGQLDQHDALTGAVVCSAIGGTAGIGKTALALHFAHQVADRFPDGQLYVNLRGFDPSGEPVTPAEGIRGFLDALAVPPEQIPADVEAQAGLYRSLVADKRILIVLDNAAGTAQVRPMLPASPGCLVLVTSRRRLGELAVAVGAHLLTLDVLSHAEAHELLARRLGPERAAREARAVGELTELCDRLPLALAIVAARAATHPGFPLIALAAQLRDARGRLDALDAGESAAEIRAVFSWSYQRLSEPAARMFRLLGLHPGPDISAAAAASLAGCTLDQARQALFELMSAHMLTEHVPGRYAFHDLLRVYATEHAEATDDEADRRNAVQRVLDHYLHSAQRADRLLNPGRDQLALAAPCAGTAPKSLETGGEAMTWFKAEHRALLATIAHAAGAGFDRHAWQLASAMSTFLDRRGLWHDWAAVQHKALDAVQQLGDQPGQAHVRYELGRAWGRLDPGVSRNHLRDALILYRSLGDLGGQARTHQAFGMVYAHQGRHREALRHDMRALELYSAAGNRHGRARSLNNIGWCHAQLGKHEEAIACCEEALRLFEELGDRCDEAASCWDSLGYAHHQLGHHAETVDCYKEAILLGREFGDRYSQADVLIHLGEALYDNGETDAARVTWEQALAMLDDLDHPSVPELRLKLRGLARS